MDVFLEVIIVLVEYFFNWLHRSNQYSKVIVFNMPKLSFSSTITSRPILFLENFLFISSSRDRIITALGNDPNIYTQVIKNLSLPVNRLEKYAGLLKEYLYNLEVSMRKSRHS